MYVPDPPSVAVYPRHPTVLSQQSHRTIGDAEAKIKKAGDREQKQKDAEEKRKGEFHVVELWKPLASTVPFFVAAEKECVRPLHLPFFP